MKVTNQSNSTTRSMLFSFTRYTTQEGRIQRHQGLFKVRVFAVASKYSGQNEALLEDAGDSNGKIRGTRGVLT